MEHIVQFGITIDDDAIRRNIETNAMNAVVDSITREIKANLPKRFGVTDWQRVCYDSISHFIEENKAEIMQEMTKALIEKVGRTKAYKEAVEAGLNGGSNEQ